MATTDSPLDDFRDLTATLGALYKVLGPAVAARYQAPPGRVYGGGLVPNPTEDVVLDPRRWELSTRITRTSRALRRATAELLAAHVALDTALADWEGRKE